MIGASSLIFKYIHAIGLNHHILVLNTCRLITIICVCVCMLGYVCFCTCARLCARARVCVCVCVCVTLVLRDIEDLKVFGEEVEMLDQW